MMFHYMCQFVNPFPSSAAWTVSYHYFCSGSAFFYPHLELLEKIKIKSLVFLIASTLSSFILVCSQAYELLNVSKLFYSLKTLVFLGLPHLPDLSDFGVQYFPTERMFPKRKTMSLQEIEEHCWEELLYDPWGRAIS